MLLGLSDADQTRQLGVAEVPGALDAAAVAKKQSECASSAGGRGRQLHSRHPRPRLLCLALKIIRQHVDRNTLLAAVLRARAAPLTISLQQALDLFGGSLRGHPAITSRSAPETQQGLV